MNILYIRHKNQGYSEQVRIENDEEASDIYETITAAILNNTSVAFETKNGLKFTIGKGLIEGISLIPSEAAKKIEEEERSLIEERQRLMLQHTGIAGPYPVGEGCNYTNPIKLF